MKKWSFYFIFLICSLLLAACSSTKHIPANDKLYTGAVITISGTSSVRERKVLDEDLEGLTRPRPNSKLLGIRFKLGIYNMFYNKKPKSFFGKLRDKLGEPPVLFSQVDVQQNIKILQNHLQNKGYFKADVTGDSSVRGKTASVKFKAVAGVQYTINAVQFPTDSSDLSKAINESASKSFLIKGKPFDLDVIKGERSRIDAFVKERGFYFFSPDDILIRTDSSIGNYKVNMYVVIKPQTPTEATEIFKINNVYIYSGYSLNSAKEDTSKQYAKWSNGFYLIDPKNRYKPGVFQNAMQFDNGDVYSRNDHNQTLSRLINLNEFKFVQNKFTVARTDTPMLDVSYYLTPLPGKSLRAQATLINRSNNLNGQQLTFSLLNRNLFHGGEQMNLSAYIGTDVQFSGALSGYNTFRTGSELDFTIPKFVIPFGDLNNNGGYMPRTTIRMGYDILNRSKLYSLNSYRFEYGYTWKPNIQRQNEFFPISINYVQPLSITRAYDSLIQLYPGLNHATEKQFILGSNYQWTYNEQANGLQPINSYFLNGLVDLSGNIAGLLTHPNAKAGNTVKILGAPFDQYIKFEFDGRYYRKIGLKSTWANRIDIGIGIPYGNSIQLPYIKQFFVGGNNSLRGFRSRSVGPGTYHYVGNNTIIPDQTGDMKLEINTEFRPHISGPFYGAIFLEGGNIWLMSDTIYTHKPGSQFTGKFLSQLAVDAGIGLRVDVTIFVIRLDVGFPLRKPWEQNPWVINQIRFSNPAWKRENLVFNLGIGYPF